uniref:Uncharacterized mitochondrial protein AtMg00810-like n=1 Tax=Tanacetum cinerariifolium TaxID=118510 RepID=A0A6L2L4G7_TANCI|nr:uncharacterized mitochondrial protein AtMg00810-like [Tanacetum cinerariifolium]
MGIPTSIGLVSCDGLGGYDWSDQAKEEPIYAFMAYTSLSSDSKIVDKPIAKNNKSCKEETEEVRKNNVALIIEEWVLDNEDENVTQPNIIKKIVRPNIVKKEFVKPRQQKKTDRKTVKKVEHNSLMKKMYCLVVTDDYSRFTWVFFLTNKDETSGILKSFITRIENLVDHKVKVIRCDNETEFKNREMSQFCEMKGIMRQFSVARNPKQNKVSERRNKTLIEAARTMLADSKFPTTFWAKAVNTACYVHNRVKAFRVFNSRTRIVEENLHIRFSESTSNVAGSRPDWLFDIEALTRTMNYEPIVAGTQFNGFADQRVFRMMGSNLQVMNERSLTVNATGTNEDNKLTFDPNMPALEDVGTFDFLNEDEDDDAVADMNNLDITIQVSPTPTIRIHKDHPLDQVIKDLHLATQTTNMTNNLEEHRWMSRVLFFMGRLKKRCMYVNHRDLKIQTFLIEYTRLKKHYMDYIKLLEPRMKPCQHIYWTMDFKEEKLTRPCLSKGLQVKQKNDGIFISQDKYVDEILKKFRFIEVKNASTPMETQNPLLKDEDGEEVDVHMYKSMIGSLMYLTFSRPNIMFAVCVCARYQLNPKFSHLHAVKRIFRYLKGHPKLGLWYPKDSPFDLEAYIDSDYVGASLDRKSTTEGF